MGGAEVCLSARLRADSSSNASSDEELTSDGDRMRSDSRRLLCCLGVSSASRKAAGGIEAE